MIVVNEAKSPGHSECRWVVASCDWLQRRQIWAADFKVSGDMFECLSVTGEGK